MKSQQKLAFVVLMLAIAAGAYWAISALTPQKITVAVDAPLASMRIFDPSDMDAARLYFAENPDSRMQLKELFYNFDPKGSAPGFEAAMKDGVQLFVTTQPSSTLVASEHLFSGPDALVINTSATSPTMTGKDDYMLRIIADARQEQEAIADYINTLPGQRLLVLQDSANAAYTDPAFKHFVQHLRQSARWQVSHERFEFDSFRPNELAPIVSQPFDALYILGGDFRASMGNMVQLFHQTHPNAPIVLTPWARSNNIFELAGPALNQMVVMSHHPSKANDPAIASYLNRFKEGYGYQPMAMALLVRQALEILEQAIAAGNRTPAEIRQYILSQDVLQTSLGDIRLDRNGDVMQIFHPLDNLPREMDKP